MEPNELEDADDIAAIQEVMGGRPQATDTEEDAHTGTPPAATTVKGERATDPNPDPEDDGNEGSTPDAGTAATSKTQVNPHKVIRNLRRSEQRLRQENERLKAQLQSGTAQPPAGTAAPSPAPDDDDISDEELRTLEDDFPAMAKLAKQNRRLREQLAGTRGSAPTQPQANTPADDDFTPPELPADVQAAVDEVPQLLDWQNDPEQSRFRRAVAMDAYLQNHPKWKQVDMAERFQEIVRRIQAEDDEASQQHRHDPDAIERRAAAARPRSLSDIGGAGPRDPAKDLSVQRLAAMNDVELLQNLGDLD